MNVNAIEKVAITAMAKNLAKGQTRVENQLHEAMAFAEQVARNKMKKDDIQVFLQNLQSNLRKAEAELELASRTMDAIESET